MELFELDAGIKPELPDPRTMFKLETGVVPKVPDPFCSQLNLGASVKPKLEAGIEPKPAVPVQTRELTGASSSSPLAQMETPALAPKQLPDASTTSELDAGIKIKPRALLNLERSIKQKLRGACAKIKLEAGVIEPKPEPREEDATYDDDWEISPVSGNHPFFTTVLSRSQVHKSFQLTIPTRFQRHLPEARVPAVLLCRGRSWSTSYCGDLKCKKLDAAWRDFAVDNRLRVGDACVFELAEAGADRGKGVVFRVQVLRGGLPAEVTSRGATSDEPLVILD